MSFPLFDPPKPKAPPAATLQPRPYQQEAIDNSFRAWADGSRGVLVRMATGMGKTATAAFTATRWLQQSDMHRVMVLCHERQLVTQWERELKRFTGLQVGVEMAQRQCYPNAIPSIVIASRATLQERTIMDEFNEETQVSRLNKFDNRLHWLIVVDEAHRYAMKLTSCGHIFEHFHNNPEARNFCLTATPERTDGTTLEMLAPSVAIDYRMAGGGRSAVAEGWAVPFDQRYILVENVDFRNIAQVGGDFSEGELGAVLSEQETLNSLCQPMLEIVGDRQNLIFSATVEMADAVALWLNAKAGRKVAESLNGNDKHHHRQRVYENFEAKRFQHLSVTGLCREGYDNPSLSAVTVFRPTKSRPLAEQMKGRGCRPLKGIVDGLDTAEERLAAIAASDKPDCLIIDLVGVTGLDDCASTLDIYRDGESDEVVDRAKQIMLDGETDAAAALEQADEEEKAEKERLDREAEKRRQEEMDRRAQFQADVEYTQINVQQGHGLGVVRDTSQQWAANQTFGFGKHRGKRVGSVDSGYLKWTAEQQPSSKIGKACAQELKARSKPARSTPVMPHGMHKGKPMDQLPPRFLQALARGEGVIADAARTVLEIKQG